jgi:hypothetical protein
MVVTCHGRLLVELGHCLCWPSKLSVAESFPACQRLAGLRNFFFGPHAGPVRGGHFDLLFLFFNRLYLFLDLGETNNNYGGFSVLRPSFHIKIKTSLDEKVVARFRD